MALRIVILSNEKDSAIQETRQIKLALTLPKLTIQKMFWCLHRDATLLTFSTLGQSVRYTQLKGGDCLFLSQSFKHISLGWLAPRQKHWGRKSWLEKTVYFMGSRSREQGKNPRRKGSGTRAPVSSPNIPPGHTQQCALLISYASRKPSFGNQDSPPQMENSGRNWSPYIGESQGKYGEEEKDVTGRIQERRCRAELWRYVENPKESCL